MTNGNPARAMRESELKDIIMGMFHINRDTTSLNIIDNGDSIFINEKDDSRGYVLFLSTQEDIFNYVTGRTNSIPNVPRDRKITNAFYNAHLKASGYSWTRTEVHQDG